MTLKSNLWYSTKTAQVVVGNFSSTGTNLYLYSGTQPTTGTLVTTGSPGFINLGNYAGQLIATSSNWAFVVDSDGVLVFNPTDYPPVTTVTGAGTISWCALVGNSISVDGSIIGKVTLGGGDGLIQVANDGAGGGTGLATLVGDNISVVSFGLKWEI